MAVPRKIVPSASARRAGIVMRSPMGVVGGTSRNRVDTGCDGARGLAATSPWGQKKGIKASSDFRPALPACPPADSVGARGMRTNPHERGIRGTSRRRQKGTCEYLATSARARPCDRKPHRHCPRPRRAARDLRGYNRRPNPSNSRMPMNAVPHSPDLRADAPRLLDPSRLERPDTVVRAEPFAFLIAREQLPAAAAGELARDFPR